jgi:hypothetical protein
VLERAVGFDAVEDHEHVQRSGIVLFEDRLQGPTHELGAVVGGHQHRDRARGRVHEV